MRPITEIYEEYKIMPNLAEHQLRVAAVASMICENISIPVERDIVLTACLLHDMGNIIKFKLDYFPDIIPKENLAYWQNVREEYLERYGHDEHRATLEIVQELGVPTEVPDVIASIGFSHSSENREDADFNKKIAAYADMRVSPYGIVSLEERLEESHKRYGGPDKSTTREDSIEEEEREMFDNALREIENQLFAMCEISPEDINDESIQSHIVALKEFSI